MYKVNVYIYTLRALLYLLGNLAQTRRPPSRHHSHHHPSPPPQIAGDSPQHLTGCFVGRGVGRDVGRGVGLGVGLGVGEVVGEAVGEVVGRDVPPTSATKHTPSAHSAGVARRRCASSPAVAFLYGRWAQLGTALVTGPIFLRRRRAT